MTDKDLTLTLTRQIAASPMAVWRCWTEPVRRSQRATSTSWPDISPKTVNSSTSSARPTRNCNVGRDEIKAYFRNLFAVTVVVQWKKRNNKIIGDKAYEK